MHRGGAENAERKLFFFLFSETENKKRASSLDSHLRESRENHSSASSASRVSGSERAVCKTGKQMKISCLSCKSCLTKYKTLRVFAAPWEHISFVFNKLRRSLDCVCWKMDIFLQTIFLLRAFAALRENYCFVFLRACPVKFPKGSCEAGFIRGSPCTSWWNSPLHPVTVSPLQR